MKEVSKGTTFGMLATFFSDLFQNIRYQKHCCLNNLFISTDFMKMDRVS